MNNRFNQSKIVSNRRRDSGDRRPTVGGSSKDRKQTLLF
jgi:hypothetical protein